MSTSRDDSPPEAIGERILTTPVAGAKEAWSDRLVAAYALGSLAHGGFSIHVSDVDLGFILSDPLGDQDTEGMANLSAAIKASVAPLATRLSVFWGSIATLSGQTSGDRPLPHHHVDQSAGDLQAVADLAVDLHHQGNDPLKD